MGKSTLVNALIPGAASATGALSRIGRGRQTTRVVWLYSGPGFWVADSPGFGSLQVEVDDLRQLRAAFAEWAEAECRFDDCLHLGEPGCAVMQGLNQGRYDRVRYLNYRALVEEVRSQPRSR